jgi:chromosome segregation ATPase
MSVVSRPRLWILLVGAVLTAGPVPAQSLGEVAAREREKRAKQDKPPRTYTNEDLKKVGRPGEAGSSSSPATQPAGESPAEASESSSDEARWRQRADDARKVVASAEESARAIQDRIDALRLDRDPTRVMDPFRLQAIEAEIAKALEALEAAKAEVARAKQALEALQDEARRAGVPPGWLRER